MLDLWVPAGDVALLAIVALVEQDTYAPVRFVALFFVAAHAHFQGQERGLAVAGGAAALLVGTAVVTDPPVPSREIEFYETVFSVSCLALGAVLGALRTSESMGRLRAEELTQRTFEVENALLRKVAESIHDGPVQELTSLDLMLASAEQAATRGEHGRARLAIYEAREVAKRNIQTLRDEIVSLGPQAFHELSFAIACEQCVNLWERRCGCPIRLDIDEPELRDDVADALFRIAQEAVTNAGRHANPSFITVWMHPEGDWVGMGVRDDGSGFGDVEPFQTGRAGHIGLASMRARAEMIGGELEIDSSEHGTEVKIRAPIGGRHPGDDVGRPFRFRRLSADAD
jgi:signal transduction histidine kinase